MRVLPCSYDQDPSKQDTSRYGAGSALEGSPRAFRAWPLADAIDPRYRALVLLATFGSLRWGELAALRRNDIHLTNRPIRAAMIYLHSTDPRQRALADAVDKAARDELR